MFSPLAVVGRGCVLPDALTPQALWNNIAAGRSAVTDVPPGRWAMPSDRILGPRSESLDVTHSTRGGYVTGFDAVFDPSGLRVDASILEAFDPVVTWPLHAARQALREAGLGDAEPTHHERTAVILGNLSFPTSGMAKFGERVFLEQQASFGGPLAEAFRATASRRGGRAEDRFMSGLPAQLIASALGLSGEAFCLDAACASSLYAVALAANALHSHRADVVLCGAVNAADSLFLHVGFTALGALSSSGQTRPFHRDADGLIPGEGAGVVALMRLEDAQAEDRPIFGIIRGVGLSNDGRARNLLAPSSEGQVRALRAAYACANVSPTDVSLLECHATGTAVGDGTEVESLRTVFDGASPRGIGTGSLKSNLGHLITGAGVAGMLKVMGAFEHQMLPPTLHVDAPLGVFEDANLPLRLLREAEPWSAARKLAGISAFGFGGNNAHVVMEAPTSAPVDLPSVVLQVPETIVVTGLGYRSRTCESVEAWDAERRRVQLGRKRLHESDSVHVDVKGVKFPPNALKASLPQQLLAFEAIREAMVELDAEIDAGTLDKNRVGVLVGMQCDVDVTTPGIRWRIAEWADPANEAPAWVAALRDAVGPAVTAERVLGQMPNIPANRSSVQHDLRGLGFTISSEELSGLSALRVAQDFLANGTLDAVVVAATDVCDDERHRAAMRALVGQEVSVDDAAVALILRRESDVDRYLASIDDVAFGNDVPPPRPGDICVSALGSNDPASPGHAQAASGLLEVAQSILDVTRGVERNGEVTLGRLSAPRTHVTSLGGARGSATVRPGNALRAAMPTGFPLVLTLQAQDEDALRLRVKALATSPNAIEAALRERPTPEIGARLAVVADDLEAMRDKLEAFVALGDRPIPDARCDVAFSTAPPFAPHQVALAFGGASAPQAGDGETLLSAFPAIRQSLDEQIQDLARAFRAPLHFRKDRARRETTTYLDELLVGSALMQTHARVLRDQLRLQDTVAMGFSLGEANALMAFGIWNPAKMLNAVEQAPLFRSEVAGEYSAVRSYFERVAIPIEDPIWATAIVRGPIDDVLDAAEREPGAFVSLVHADDECVVAGAPSAVRRVLSACRRDGAFIPCAPAVHTLAATPAADAYRALHTTDTVDTGTKVLTAGALAGGNARLVLEKEACATAVTAQALERVDYPALLRAAVADGIRVVVACGARGLCAEWARRCDTGVEVFALAMHRPSIPEDTQLARVAASLFALGLEVDLSAFSLPPVREDTLRFSVPAHHAVKRLPPPSDIQASPPRETPSQHAPSTETLRAGPTPPNQPSDKVESMPPAPLLPLPDVVTFFHREAPKSAVMHPAPPLEASHAAPLAPLPPAPSRTPSPAAPSPAPLSTSHHFESSETLVSNENPPTGMTSTSAEVSDTNSGWDAVAQAQVDLGSAHQRYVENAAQVHQTFLQMQRTQVEHLARIMRGESSGDLVVPANPLAAPFIQSHPNAAAAIPAAAPAAHAPAPVAAPRTEAPKPSSPAPARPAPARPAPVAQAPQPMPAKPFPTSTGARYTDGDTHSPWLDRAALERVASDKISSVLGPLFERQDGFRRQVRMPEPPLLLTDRVLCTDAQPGVLEKGRTIWTESDVTWDKWYIHNGRVPASVLIESGQADLLLISWMGVDFENAGQRVYRLLGCDLTYGDALPAVGETLHYDIHIDGFARMGKTHMFFFHSDCRLGGPDGDVVLSVRNGQAGFFDDEELRQSGGILWTPADVDEDFASVTLAAPQVPVVKSSLSTSDLVKWTEGDGYACFGEGYERLAPHVRTPAIQGVTKDGQDMRLLDRVTTIDPAGGPWGRGYLRAELDLRPDQWFFDGHFKDDPCMPGTIMFEGCLQTMGTYLAALGMTLDADGYRFEPVGHKAYALRCRGQAIPTSKQLVYEVFVKEVVGGALPRMRADILVTVDGLKALHCDDVELQLVVDWPMSDRPELLGDVDKPSGADAVGGVVRRGTVAPDAIFDQTALLATGWGRPSDAFGEMYRPFDGTRRVPRLPGPPYHFMSRVTELDGPPAGSVKAGNTCAVEYDVPPDAWFYDASPAETMPFCVLLEVALQPCGWLSSYVGSALTSEGDLFYRNLDGQGTLHAEIPRDVGTLITRATMTKSSSSGGMIIQEFSLEVTARNAAGEISKVYDATTAFGFFPAAALAQQVGIGSTPAEKAALAAPSPRPVVEILDTEALLNGPIRLPKAPLLMIDRVTGHWPAEGDHLGRVRTEKTVDVTEWFFKAHFFQDPVQPGSLGIEAMVQAVTYWMIDEGMGQNMVAPRVTPLGLGSKMVWKYRGQVIPKNKRIEVEATIRSKTDDVVVADCSLWVDGLRIYTATGLSVGLVDAGAPGFR